VPTAVYEWRKCDTHKSREMVKALRVRWGDDGKPIPAENIHIDAGTFGGGVVDELRAEGLQVDAVDFAASPRGAWRSLLGEIVPRNLRAEMYWNLRRLLQEGVAQIPRELNGERFRAWDEAQWTQFNDEPTAQGTKLTLEKKTDVAKRHGRSPDYMDAMVLAWTRKPSRPRFGRNRKD